MSDQVIYKIPCVNFFRLEAELNKLNKRAEKAGWRPASIRILRTVTESHRHKALGDYDFAFHECVLDGGPPKISSWSLIAVVEPLKDTKENIVREVPGQVCPAEYRTTNLRCDHCLAVRNRTAVFILRHEDGFYTQVGRNCIADFLEDPAGLILSSAQLLGSLYDIVGHACSSVEKEWAVFDVHYFVTVVAMLTRKLGWVPRSQSDIDQEATADIAMEICSGTKESARLIRKHHLAITEEDRQLAKNAVEWAKGIENASSTYLHDLGVTCRSNYVSVKTAGYVASVISAYNRQIVDTGKSHRSAADSKHVGNVGERMHFDDLAVTGKYPYVAAGFPKTTVKFVDPSGNILVWFASGDPEWIKVGDIVNVKATVVWHEDKDGIKTTKIKRVTKHDEDETGRSDEGSDGRECGESLPASEAST